MISDSLIHFLRFSGVHKHASSFPPQDPFNCIFDTNVPIDINNIKIPKIIVDTIKISMAKFTPLIKLK